MNLKLNLDKLPQRPHDGKDYDRYLLEVLRKKASQHNKSVDQQKQQAEELKEFTRKKLRRVKNAIDMLTTELHRASPP